MFKPLTPGLMSEVVERVARRDGRCGMSTELSVPEHRQLTNAEQVIEQGLRSFVEVGNASLEQMVATGNWVQVPDGMALLPDGDD